MLENRAWGRVKSKDASLSKITAAWFVTIAIKSNQKLGMGMKKGNALFKKPKRRGGALKIGFKRTVKNKVRK